jgi:hypothetical protein
MRAKLFALKVLPLHVVEVGQFERLTRFVPSGALPAIVLPSADISYKSA